LKLFFASGSSARKTSQWLVFSENGKRSEATRSQSQVVFERSAAKREKRRQRGAAQGELVMNSVFSLSNAQKNSVFLQFRKRVNKD
jgi:hypothetical protein